MVEAAETEPAEEAEVVQVEDAVVVAEKAAQNETAMKPTQKRFNECMRWRTHY